MNIKKITFGEVPCGNVFEYKGDYFQKSTQEDCELLNTINLSNGDFIGFNQETMVVHYPNAYWVIK